jgi:hypothetical protein
MVLERRRDGASLRRGEAGASFDVTDDARISRILPLVFTDLSASTALSVDLTSRPA